MVYVRSIVYLIGFICLYSGLLRRFKHEGKASLAVWLPATFILVQCFQVLMAGIVGLTPCPVTALTVGILDLALGIFLWVSGIRSGEKQAYGMNGLNAIAMVGIVLFAVAFGYLQYGPELAPNFLVADGTAHFMEAMRVIKTRGLVDMYYHSLNNALLMEVFAPIWPFTQFYKAYCLGVVIQLAMGGLMIYGLVSRYAKDRFLKIAALFVPFLYMAGYPFNAYEYGFLYLDEAVTLIMVMALVTDFYDKNLMPKLDTMVILLAGCTTMVVCYALFAPMMFIAIFYVINRKTIRSHKSRAAAVGEKVSWGPDIKEGFLQNLLVFVIPCLFALLYTYRGIFVSDGLSVGGSIKEEGSIYRDLFSTFVFWLPFLIYGVYRLIKSKKRNTILIFGLLTALNSLAFLAMGRLGMVSGYYFYKYHYLMWSYLFVLAFIGLSEMDESARKLALCNIAVWAGIFVMFLTKFDYRLWQYSSRLAEPRSSTMYNNLYDFNLAVVASDPGDDYYRRVTPQLTELLAFIYENLDEEAMETFVPALAWKDSYVATGILDIENKYKDYWPTGPAGYTDEYLDSIRDAQCVLFTYDGPLEEYEDLDDKFEIWFQNADGFVGVRK